MDPDLLVNNTSGTAANTTTATNTPGNGTVYYTAAIDFTRVTTVYVWATTWDTAVMQLFVSPQGFGSQLPMIWIPVPSGILSANGLLTFNQRWRAIKAEVYNASALSVGLYCCVITPY